MYQNPYILVNELIIQNSDVKLVSELSDPRWACFTFKSLVSHPHSPGARQMVLHHEDAVSRVPTQITFSNC